MSRARPVSRGLPAALAALALLFPAGCGDSRAPAAARAGNLRAVAGWPAPILIVGIDALRADHVSFAAEPAPDRPGPRGARTRDTTPFLSELAARGIVFDRAYAHASWSRASMASLWTSRLPGDHGCTGRTGRLPEAATTLAEVLRDAGWDTRGLFNNGNLEAVFGLGQGFADSRFVRGRTTSPYADAASLQRPWEELLAQLSPPPFLVALQLVDPHAPYHAHAAHDFRRPDGGSFDGSDLALGPFRKRAPSAAHRRRAIDLYDGELAALDARLRRMFERLRATWLDSAWIVVVGSHGEGLWDHGSQGHGHQLYEEQVRVPLIVVPPGGLTTARRVPEPFPLIDLAPTLLDLVGLPACPDFHGQSWLASLLGDAAAPVRPIVLQQELDGERLAAVIDGKDKLIVDLERGTRRLFDLSGNPHEQLAFALDPDAQPSAVADRLAQVLAETLARQARAGSARSEPLTAADLPVALRLHLAALGYTGADG